MLYTPFGMAVTMTHIAQEAGVSVAVVSRLLRGDPSLRISEKRRKEILQTKDRLGGLKSKPRKRRLTRTIVAPVNRLFSAPVVHSNVIQSELFRHFEGTLKEHGFRLHLSFFEPDSMLDTFASTIRSGACDGLLLLSGICNEAVAELLRMHDVPHVSSDFHAERFHVNTVRAHTSDGIRQAAEHLLKLGHRRIGFVGPRNSYRYPLTVAAMVQLGLPLEESLNCWVENVTSGPQEQWRLNTRKAFAGWLETSDGITALICANDLVAQGVSDVLRDRGLEPGSDISLVGHDNLEQRGSLKCDEPMITTVDNPTDLIGRRLADLLLNQVLHGQNQVVHERIPAHLIVRGSSGRCPTSSGS